MTREEIATLLTAHPVLQSVCSDGNSDVRSVADSIALPVFNALNSEDGLWRERTEQGSLIIEENVKVIERLRAALTEIARLLWPTGNHEHPAAIRQYAAWKTAQAALSHEQNARPGNCNNS